MTTGRTRKTAPPDGLTREERTRKEILAATRALSPYIVEEIRPGDVVVHDGQAGDVDQLGARSVVEVVGPHLDGDVGRGDFEPDGHGKKAGSGR